MSLPYSFHPCEPFTSPSFRTKDLQVSQSITQIISLDLQYSEFLLAPKAISKPTPRNLSDV